MNLDLHPGLARRTVILRYGAAGRDRTCGLSLRRQTLFQLSYNGIRVSLGQTAIKHYSSVSVIELMPNN